MAAELSKHKRAREIKKSKRLGLDYHDATSTPTGKDTRSLSSTPAREVIKVDSDASGSNTPTLLPTLPPTLLPTLPPKKPERALGEIEENFVIKVCFFFYSVGFAVVGFFFGWRRCIVLAFKNGHANRHHSRKKFR